MKPRLTGITMDRGKGTVLCRDSANEVHFARGMNSPSSDRIDLCLVRTMGGNMRFSSLFAAAVTTLCLFVEPALAEDAGSAAAGYMALAPIGAGLGMAFASGLGAFSQARVCAAALEGIGRNPGAAGQMQTPMILGLALIESLVLFTLAIAAKLSGLI